MAATRTAFMGIAAAACGASLLTAPPAQAHVQAQPASPSTATAAVSAEQPPEARQARWNCRKGRSSISGASAWATLCWENPRGVARLSLKGSVRDSANDGKYAQFRIHWRVSRGTYWQTKTAIIKTTKGKRAPITLPVNMDTMYGLRFKDFWMQACKQGSGKRTCDSRWR
ncbi:hypothetical protein SMC26_29755 [Actinomadura fulvescens]|uniref:Secreted protein n=1 Tax=Actinomadura fulvescens TaxID=46160 RepID=A0ABP6CUX3_9ACTN